jgi:hypothetical protein
MKTPNRVKTALFFCILIFTFVEVNAQTPINGVGISAKSGACSGKGSNFYFPYGAELKWIRNSFLFSVEYFYSDGFEVLSSPQTFFHQADLLIGKYIDFGKFRVEYQAGMGYIEGVASGEFLGKSGGFIERSIYEKIKYNTICIPLKVGIKYIPLRYLAIGINLHGNLNKYNPYFGPSLELEFGLLRN